MARLARSERVLRRTGRDPHTIRKRTPYLHRHRISLPLDRSWHRRQVSPISGTSRELAESNFESCWVRATAAPQMDLEVKDPKTKHLRQLRMLLTSLPPHAPLRA